MVEINLRRETAPSVQPQHKLEAHNFLTTSNTIHHQITSQPNKCQYYKTPANTNQSKVNQTKTIQMLRWTQIEPITAMKPKRIHCLIEQLQKMYLNADILASSGHLE